MEVALAICAAVILGAGGILWDIYKPARFRRRADQRRNDSGIGGSSGGWSGGDSGGDGGGCD